MREFRVFLLKLGVSAAILAWLLIDMHHRDPETYSRLWVPPRAPGLLVIGIVCFLAAIGVGFVRWRLLVRALGIPFSWNEAVRYGLLGFLLDFLALGTVGGDLVRAFCLARRRPDARAKAVASVGVDRLIGLLVLLGMTFTACLAVETQRSDSQVEFLIRVVQWSACAALVMLVLVFLPGVHRSRLLEVIARIPSIGRPIRRLAMALGAYRQQKRALALAAVLSMLLIVLNVSGFFLIANGFWTDTPSWKEHLLIVPLAQMSSILPLPLDALGVFDAALDLLYRRFSAGTNSVGRGLMVAMAYRTASMIVVFAALVVYFARKRELRQAVAGSKILRDE